MITILGLGSLLSEESARRTCPNLENFRLAKLHGYKRIFNKTDSDIARKGQIPKDTNAYACLSAIPDKTMQNMVISAFQMPETDWLAFLKREFEYKLVSVKFEELDGTPSQGILCVGDYAHDQECELVCQSDPFRFQLWQDFKQKCSEPMWREDLLPGPTYLQRCLDICTDRKSVV